MRLIVSKRAEKHIKKLPDFVKIAVIKKIRELVVTQDNVQIKKLSGYDNVYRVRVGSYRIVYYQMRGGVEILAVLHRRDVYRGKLG